MGDVGSSTKRSKRRRPRDGGLRSITAIVRVDLLERVERRLQDLRVPGISVSKVKGYGECQDFFARDRTTEHARIEIFLTRERAEEIARAIVDIAHTGVAGDGLVVVQPVESIYRIRSGDVATSDEIGGCECVRAARHDAPGARSVREVSDALVAWRLADGMDGDLVGPRPGAGRARGLGGSLVGSSSGRRRRIARGDPEAACTRGGRSTATRISGCWRISSVEGDARQGEPARSRRREVRRAPECGKGKS